MDDIKSQMPRLLNRSYRPDSSAISTGNSVECHILSTGSLLQKQSVMKKDLGNRGAGLSVSQLQWTLTGMRDINQGVRAATVFASSLIAASGYSTNRTTFVVAVSHPDTSPIYFYHRGKPFFECASTTTPQKLFFHTYLQVYEFLTSLGRV